MPKLRAAVLATRRSMAMGGRQPSTLAPLGDEQPLLYYILHGLKEAGIEDLLVVTGFGAAAVDEFVGEHWSGTSASIFNARWASWGDFHSLRLALDQSPGFDVVVVDSDVVVTPDVYKRVIATPGDLVLAVQRRPRLAPDDTRVELDGDAIKQVSKSVKPARSHGEFAGVSLVRPTAARLYLDTATDWEWRAETARHYEDVYDAILGRSEARPALVRMDEYAKVDAPEDLTSAVSVIERHPDVWVASQPA